MTGAEFSGVDIDLLADYIGGALEGTPDESVVAALITGDPAWRAAYESLGGRMALVGAELGRMTAEPMPAELATRLDAMLRAGETPAAPRLSVVRDPDPAGDGAAAVPAAKRDRHGRRMRWATPIAIAAGTVAFVGFGLDYLAGRDDQAQDSAASGVAEQSLPAAAEVVLASGTDYTRATLAEEPPQPLAAADEGASTAAKQEQTRASATEPALSRFAVGTALEECFAAIERENAGGTIVVRSVDYARFDGRPAVVVRFTADNGAWAWASGAGCGTPAGGADTLDRVPVR